MKKSEIPYMPGFFDRYILQVEDIGIIEALEKNALDSIYSKVTLEKLGDRVYAENKWTARDILQHVLDTERILAYRALRFARNDKTALPGYEEDDYGKMAEARNRTLEDLFEESALLRSSTIALFKSFTRDMLLRDGICFNQNISVIALGFVIAGHPIHHANVIRDRYYPLLQ